MMPAHMAPKRTALPTGVFPKGRWYYRVRAEGNRRIWTKLCPIADGLPALYAALAQQLADQVADDRMPALIAAWQRNVMHRHAAKTQVDDKAMCKVIADSFADFRAGEVQAPDVADFLQPLQAKPRTHNAYRGMLRELLRYSIERGFRTENPVAHIRTLPTPARTRYITDSEMRRIKVGGIYGDDGKRTRSGLMLAALIDVAYLTGQRIGDLLQLRWERDPDDVDAPHVTDKGLFFRPDKTENTTGAALVVHWTPRLRDAIGRIKVLQAERLLKRRAGQRLFSGYLFTGQDGKHLSYWGASSMWQRARKRADVRGATFHDLRAKALTDLDARAGRRAANQMGNHSTEQQTADYIRSRQVNDVGATR